MNSVIIMDTEMMHKNHEHRDDTQQLDARITPFTTYILECSGKERLA